MNLKKKIVSSVLLFIAFFSLQILNVSAAERTCIYDDGNYSYLLDLYIFDDTSAEGKIVKYAGDYKQEGRNTSKVRNWNEVKDDYIGKNNCPKYTLIHYESNMNEDVNYVYVSEDKEQLIQWADEAGLTTYYLFEGEEANLGSNTHPIEPSPDLPENNSANNSTSNGSFNPAKLCQNGNCNIDLDAFCNEAPTARTLQFLGYLFYIVKILVPAIIIIMGIVDMIKIITSGKVDDINKIVKNMGIKLIGGAIIFMLPSIVLMIFRFADETFSPEDGNFANCYTCVLDPENCQIQK